MMKANKQNRSSDLPACPKCGNAEAVRAMSASPGHFFCARCQLDLPLEGAPAQKNNYKTKGRA